MSSLCNQELLLDKRLMRTTAQPHPTKETYGRDFSSLTQDSKYSLEHRYRCHNKIRRHQAHHFIHSTRETSQTLNNKEKALYSLRAFLQLLHTRTQQCSIRNLSTFPPNAIWLACTEMTPFAPPWHEGHIFTPRFHQRLCLIHTYRSHLLPVSPSLHLFIPLLRPAAFPFVFASR